MATTQVPEEQAQDLYLRTLNGTYEEGGSVDSPVGWFARVPADDGGPDYIVRRDESGYTYAWEFTEDQAMWTMWHGLIRDYAQWDDESAPL